MVRFGEQVQGRFSGELLCFYDVFELCFNICRTLNIVVFSIIEIIVNNFLAMIIGLTVSDEAVHELDVTKRKLQEMVLRGEKLLECLEICAIHPVWVKYSREVEEGELSCENVEKSFSEELDKAKNTDKGRYKPHPV